MEAKLVEGLEKLQMNEANNNAKGEAEDDMMVDVEEEDDEDDWEG